MGLGPVTPDWLAIRQADRRWTRPQIRRMMDEWPAVRAAIQQTWGKAGDGMLCDVVQLEGLLKDLPLTERAAAVLHMSALFTEPEIQRLLAEEDGRTAIAMLHEAARKMHAANAA